MLPPFKRTGGRDALPEQIRLDVIAIFGPAHEVVGAERSDRGLLAPRGLHHDEAVAVDRRSADDPVRVNVEVIAGRALPRDEIVGAVRRDPRHVLDVGAAVERDAARILDDARRR